MSFHEAIGLIGDKYKKICADEKQAYTTFSLYNPEIYAYELLNSLYDEDKKVKNRDSFNPSHVKTSLHELHAIAKATVVEVEAQEYLDRFVFHIEHNLELIELLIELENLNYNVKTVEDRILFLLKATPHKEAQAVRRNT